MLRIHEIRLSVDESLDLLPQKIAKKIGIGKGKIKKIKIYKESIDARKKKDIKKVYTVDFLVDNEEAILKKRIDVKVEKKPDETYYYVGIGNEKLMNRPVVIGFGPSGMFCGLILAQMGYNPIILERGKSVDERTADVEAFWKSGVLNENSNCLFGEGGAGTFSDGKLNTGTKDTRIRKVLEEFVNSGAEKKILYKQKPHIGTDVLRTVVKNMRERIEDLGGEVRFNSCVTDFIIEDEKIKAVEVNGKEIINTEIAVLAVGHSARDTFELIDRKGLGIEQKPFSLGVRIEHSQDMINKAQMGEGVDALLEINGAADYKLSHRCENGRGVYSFCMCPGGYVVASSSEEGEIVTNGMSYNDRAGKNSNSALLVSVNPSDFESEEPLAGVDFQRKWEKKAFELTGSYKAPAQRLKDFMGEEYYEKKKNELADGKENTNINSSEEIEPTYMPGVEYTDLKNCLPEFVVNALKEAIPELSKKLKGFDSENAILTGVETRSSSPIRVIRYEDMESTVRGIYPIGEGAGYAGGITSSAVDGIRIAEVIASTFSNQIGE